MNDEELKVLQAEVKQIRNDFGALAYRIGEVEKALHQTSDQIVHTTQLAPPARAEQIQNKDLSAQKNIESKALVTSETNSLERRIGQYWLNRLGVISLVIGIVFLVLYSFQYFSVPLKLLTSLAFAVSLIVLGENISKKTDKKSYGYGLIGGGWALNYFTIFAMYFIPDLKIISSYPIEFSLLVAVCIGAMLQAIRCNSQTIAVMSTLLANLAIGLSGYTLNSNIAILIIAILVSIVALKQNWNALFITLIVASYTSHAFVSREAYSYSVLVMPNIGIIVASFLVSFWLIFNAATFLAKEDKTNIKMMIIAHCLNAIGFSACLSLLAQIYFPGQTSLSYALTGTFYLTLALPNIRYTISQLKTVNILIGLFFVNTAIWMHSTDGWVVTGNLFQLTLLVIIGFRFNIKAFRWFSLYLSLCFFPLWLNYGFFMAPWIQDALSCFFGIKSPGAFLIGLLATLIFGTICYFYCKPKYIDQQGNLEKTFYRHIYFCLANLAAGIIPFHMEPAPAVTCWSLEAIIAAYFSVVTKEAFFSGLVTMESILAVLALLFSISSWQWLPTITVISACYTYYSLIRSKIKSIDYPFATRSMTIVMVCGNVILTLLLLNKLSSFWLSTGLALEGLVLIGIGLALKDKAFRVSSLIVLSLLILKLLFIDLANANSLQRIVSFIAAGLVLLVSSYIYTEFTKRLNS